MPKKSDVVLTVKEIENLKPETGVREVWDAALPGFGIRAFASSGIKSWCLMTRAGSKQRRFTLGRYPEMGLKDARIEAANYLEQIARGEDPAERPTPRPEPGEMTFGDLAEMYIARECPKLKRGNNIEAVIRTKLLPHWRDTRLRDLRKRDARILTDALEADGRPMAAHQLHETYRRIFKWGLQELDEDEIGIESSPFGNLTPPVKKTPRSRTLTKDEIRSLWIAWDEIGYPTGTCQKLLLLTGQRRGEVARMLRPEIDLDTGQWIIPAERAKNKSDHLVPLSGMALDILRSMPEFSGDFLFSSTNGQRPISSFSKGKESVDKRSGVTGWTLHDLRRTFRTGLSELKVPQPVAEACLNHAKAILDRTYNLHEYADEKRDALERWAEKVHEILNPPPQSAAEPTPKPPTKSTPDLRVVGGTSAGETC